MSSTAPGASYQCYIERAGDPFRMSDVSVVVMWKERQLVPRRYGPGHFTADPYSQIVSPHGIPVDDLVSVLQKEIRRSRIDNAVLAAYEMFIIAPDVAQPFTRRSSQMQHDGLKKTYEIANFRLGGKYDLADRSTAGASSAHRA